MARGINKVTLIGNLGEAPDVRRTANGDAVVNISLATNEAWRDRNTGETVERTEWHRLVLFSKLAEIAGEYLLKGSKIYIEGKLQTRKWQDRDGNDRWTTEIVVRELQMLDSPNLERTQPSPGADQPPAAPPASDNGFEDDIPF